MLLTGVLCLAHRKEIVTDLLYNCIFVENSSCFFFSQCFLNKRVTVILIRSWRTGGR